MGKPKILIERADFKTRFQKEHIVPEEWKETMGGNTRFQKGQTSWNAETRDWQYCVDCGKRLEGYNAVRCAGCFKKFNVGENNPSYGKKHTKERLEENRVATTKRWQDPEWRAKVLKARIGTQVAWNKGKKIPQWSGKKHPNWKGGITPLRSQIRALLDNEQWRNIIFERDNYICQKCGVRGGRLEAQHIKAFNKTFSEFLKEYDQFSPMEDKETLVRLAIKYKPFWDINNGITLCKECHRGKKNNGKQA